MIKFHNLEIKISGQSVLAQNVSIDQNNSLSPTFAAGRASNLETIPNGPVTNTISIDYIFEPSGDISQKLVDRIRNYDFNSFPTKISVGGFTGMGYLNNFSLTIIPNDVILANAQYDIFTELTGALSEQPNNYYASNKSGVGHYITTYSKSYDGTTTGSILQGGYSFNSRFQPIYKIGSPVPAQVKFLNGQEQFNFTHEYPIKITHSGKTQQNTFTDFDIIELYPLSKDWEDTNTKTTLYPSSGKLISNKINIQENNIILSETQIIKYY